MTHMCNKPKFTQLARPNPAAQSGVIVKTDLPKSQCGTQNSPRQISWKRLNTVKSIKDEQ